MNSSYRCAWIALKCARPGLLGLLALALVHPRLSVAQEATVGATNGDALAEIVVTAEKRQESANHVGLTIATLGGADLQAGNVNSVADFALQVPSLTFANTPNNTPIYTLRGVGFYDVSLGASPTVTMYIDEVPLPYPILWNHQIFDLERVEVLKGPQGTLFGENATGGAINNIAAKPTNTPESGTTLTYGRFNERDFDAFVSGPITDTIKARVAVRTEHMDGWQESTSRPGDTNGAKDNTMGRLLIDFTPSDRIKLGLNLTAWQDASDTQAPQFTGAQEIKPGAANPYVAPFPYTPQNDRAADWNQGILLGNGTTSNLQADNDFSQASFRGEFELADSLQLISLSSYLHYTQKQAEDLDGLPISTLDDAADDGNIHEFFQELRLAHQGAGPLGWVAGVNYDRGTVDQYTDLSFPLAASALGAGALGYPLLNDQYTSYQRTWSWAAFGNVNYEIIPHVVLKAGVRYTETDRTARNCTSDDFAPYNAGRFFYNVLGGGAFGAYPPGSCFQFNNVGTAGLIDPPPLGAPGLFQADLREHNIPWRVGVDWNALDTLLWYVNVAKGFKAGGFPTVAASAFKQYVPVHQESVLSYEAGFKDTLADGKVQFNGAGFHYDYTDKQITAKVLDPFFGILSVLQNIPKSKVDGGELELTAIPFKGALIGTSATYVKGEITKYTGISPNGLNESFAGDAIPYSPKLQLRATIDYKHALTAGLDGFVGMGETYASSTVAIPGGDQRPANYFGGVTNTPYTIASYALMDLRAGIEAPDSHWRVELWGKNVLNRYYWTNVAVDTDTVNRYTGMPATFGVSATVRFK